VTVCTLEEADEHRYKIAKLLSPYPNKAWNRPLGFNPSLKEMPTSKPDQSLVGLRK